MLGHVGGSFLLLWFDGLCSDLPVAGTVRSIYAFMGALPARMKGLTVDVRDVDMGHGDSFILPISTDGRRVCRKHSQSIPD